MIQPIYVIAANRRTRSRLPTGPAPLLLFAALTVLILSAPTASAPTPVPQPGRIASGSPAPSFALPDVDGHLLHSDDYKGKVLVLNFWAFWCDTWKAELPYLKQLVTHEGDSGFQLIAVSVDGTRRETFEKYTDGTVPFPVCLDAGSSVSTAYHVEHVPTVVIVDAEGKVAKVFIGYPGNGPILSVVRQISAKKHISSD